MKFFKEIEQNCLISSITTYPDLLDMQKQLFKSQVQQLKFMVKTHRELTGVNPLSPDMVIFFSFYANFIFMENFLLLFLDNYSSISFKTTNAGGWTAIN